MSRKHRTWMLGLLFLSGCWYPVREHADLILCDMAAHPLDVQRPLAGDIAGPPPAPAQAEAVAAPVDDVAQVSAQPGTAPEPARPRTLAERLRIPPELPGASAPPIRLPPPGASREEKEAAMNRIYRSLPPLPAEPLAVPGLAGHALSLTDLQHLATSNSPALRQAAADLEAAKGTALQAGLYPNPTVGFEGDQMNQGATAGMLGGFIDQTIKTGGKLKLAQAAAAMDVLNAELALKRAQADLATQVRTGYFAVLVARENIKVTRALTRFADEVYQIQIEQVRGQQAAAYEPLQVRVLAVQARGALVQAHNSYLSAWKQLAAAMGLPGMPLTELAGRVDMPIPCYEYDTVLAQVLSAHTDVLSAINTIQRSRYNLALQQVTPVPDVDLRLLLQKDYTTPPFLVVNSVVLGVQLPVWDRNQGNIRQAQGTLLRAVEETHRVRSDLTSRVAQAFQRYENARVLLDYYQTQILPDQVRAYRGVYERHQQEPNEVSFPDVVTAQQTLATAVTTYTTTLGDVWTSAVELANLLQTHDLFQVDTTQPVAPVPDLEHLLPLPCSHPCSPVSDAQLSEAAGTCSSTPPARALAATGESKPDPVPQPHGTHSASQLPPPPAIPKQATSSDAPVPQNSVADTPTGVAPSSAWQRRSRSFR